MGSRAQRLLRRRLWPLLARVFFMRLVLLLLLGLLVARRARGTRVVAPARDAGLVQTCHRRLMCTIAAVGGDIGGRRGLHAPQGLAAIPFWTPAPRWWLLAMAPFVLHAVALASSTSRRSSTRRHLSLRLWLVTGRLLRSRVANLVRCVRSRSLSSRLRPLHALLEVRLLLRLLPSDAPGPDIGLVTSVFVLGTQHSPNAASRSWRGRR